jgi:hypothetical protein
MRYCGIIMFALALAALLAGFTIDATRATFGA